MDQKKFKNPSPRIKIIQKIYNSLMNPDTEIEYPKNQYKKFIKDVVSGTIERSEFIEETIKQHLSNDINLMKTDKKNAQNISSTELHKSIMITRSQSCRRPESIKR